ncbi:TolC family protein [Chitinophaga sp.]|uniref:TolC family protein n=1 Tax=Chitinophaga sp. TaxID=1869181 RepID=UPI002639BBAB|nr:TolC family protein [uncultured Chitinophaga sp.]
MFRFLMPALLLLSGGAFAQGSFPLDSAWASARRHYPLLRQQEATDRATALQLRNIRTGYLPQAELNGRATYQSDVVALPIKLPNIIIPSIPKDQYNLSLDVRQLIYDGGATSGQRDLQLARQQADRQKVEVDLHQLRQQVTQVYFNALIWDAHITARREMIAEVKQRREKLQAGVDNGTVLASQVDMLQAEALKAEQQLEEAINGKQAALATLALLTGKTGSEMDALVLPAPAPTGNAPLQRPELALFRYQQEVLGSQAKLTESVTRPKLSAFVQGGYGRPGLNMLSDKFDFYYMGGLRLNWTLWNWRYQRTERAVLHEQEQGIQAQSEAFDLQTRAKLLQQQAEINTLQTAMEKDREIVELRGKVKNVSAAQLDNGVMTVHDYLTDLYAETSAVIAGKTREIQFVYATIQYQVIKGY